MTSILTVFDNVLLVSPLPFACRAYHVVFSYRTITFIIGTFDVVRKVAVSNSRIEQSPRSTILNESSSISAIQKLLTVGRMFGDALKILWTFGFLNFNGDDGSPVPLTTRVVYITNFMVILLPRAFLSLAVPVKCLLSASKTVAAVLSARVTSWH